jgi:hypothetical protein
VKLPGLFTPFCPEPPAAPSDAIIALAAAALPIDAGQASARGIPSAIME